MNKTLPTITIILGMFAAYVFTTHIEPLFEHHPKFKVGDCAQVNYGKEKWEAQTYHMKIIAVGKSSYQTGVYVTSGIYYVTNSSMDSQTIIGLDKYAELEKCLQERK